MKLVKTIDITQTHNITVAIQCDKCNKVFTDVFELEEFYNIKFVGGYTSLFGDGVEVKIDICQKCLFEMFKDIGTRVDLTGD